MTAIRHCVFFKFRADVPQAERDAIRADLDALGARIPGLLDFAFGTNVSPEPLARGYVDGFTMDFRDAAARDAYLEHEAHKRAGARLVASLEGGIDGLMVFDLEI